MNPGSITPAAASNDAKFYEDISLAIDTLASFVKKKIIDLSEAKDLIGYITDAIANAASRNLGLAEVLTKHPDQKAVFKARLVIGRLGLTDLVKSTTPDAHKTLSCTQTKISYSRAEFIENIINEEIGFEHLDLSEATIPVFAMQKIRNMLLENSEIETIDCSFAQFNIEAFWLLMSQVAENQVLTGINLAGISMTGEKEGKLILTLLQNADLQGLVVSEAKHSEKFINLLTRNLANNSIRLTALDLSFCQLDDTSIPLLLNVIHENKQLTALDLSGNYFSASSLASLHKAREHNTVLAELHLDCNQATANAYVEAKRMVINSIKTVFQPQSPHDCDEIVSPETIAIKAPDLS